MLRFLKKLFSASAPVPQLHDPDFGSIAFFPSHRDGSTGIWQMDDKWDLPHAFANVGCSSIPGNMAGPYPEARAFLLAKRNSLLAVWEQVVPHLEKIRAEWRPESRNRPLKDVFYLSSLAMDEPITDPPGWEVSFQPRDGRWIFASIQLTGDMVTGTTCDT
jgi:hypothetical protein